MSTQLVAEEMKAKATVYHGNETCRAQLTLLLEEKGLPNGLLQTLQDIHEYGYVEDTGFVWLRRCRQHETSSKKDSFYMFDNVVICYDTEITAYFETNKIKNLTGVKAKEFMIWVNITEIYVRQRSPSATSMIMFKTPVGLSRSFPVSTFEVQSVMFDGDAVKELAEETKEGK